MIWRCPFWQGFNHDMTEIDEFGMILINDIGAVIPVEDGRHQSL